MSQLRPLHRPAGRIGSHKVHGTVLVLRSEQLDDSAEARMDYKDRHNLSANKAKARQWKSRHRKKSRYHSSKKRRERRSRKLRRRREAESEQRQEEEDRAEIDGFHRMADGTVCTCPDDMSSCTCSALCGGSECRGCRRTATQQFGVPLGGTVRATIGSWRCTSRKTRRRRRRKVFPSVCAEAVSPSEYDCRPLIVGAGTYSACAGDALKDWPLFIDDPAFQEERPKLGKQKEEYSEMPMRRDNALAEGFVVKAPKKRERPERMRRERKQRSMKQRFLSQCVADDPWSSLDLDVSLLQGRDLQVEVKATLAQLWEKQDNCAPSWSVQEVVVAIDVYRCTTALRASLDWWSLLRLCQVTFTPLEDIWRCCAGEWEHCVDPNKLALQAWRDTKRIFHSRPSVLDGPHWHSRYDSEMDLKEHLTLSHGVPVVVADLILQLAGFQAVREVVFLAELHDPWPDCRETPQSFEETRRVEHSTIRARSFFSTIAETIGDHNRTWESSIPAKRTTPPPPPLPPPSPSLSILERFLLELLRDSLDQTSG